MDLIQHNLKENEVKIFLLTKYVDDINIATSLIPNGKMWVKEGSQWVLKFSEEMEEKDKTRSQQRATIEKIKWLGDRLVPGLKLTKDLPLNHSNGMCPVLDVQVWTQKGEDGKATI